MPTVTVTATFTNGRGNIYVRLNGSSRISLDEKRSFTHTFEVRSGSYILFYNGYAAGNCSFQILDESGRQITGNTNIPTGDFMKLLTIQL